MRRALAVLIAVAGLALLTPAAMAHPLGNFSINHLSKVKISEDRVDVLYVLDEAEIPTTEQRGESRAEIVRSKQEELRENLRLGSRDPLFHLHAGLAAKAAGRAGTAARELRTALSGRAALSPLRAREARAALEDLR